MQEELKQIKKLYGEAMMHFCRNTFATILETKGELLELLLDRFAVSHELYNDLVENKLIHEFKDFIFSLTNIKVDDNPKESKSPEELMRQAGYILYECKTEEDIQAFKKYYAKDEELCTFHGGRLNTCHVFFAVKENVDEINRADFPNPERQDEYGTSVISIQFSKDFSHTLSIKNRYNHTVNNPDATFSNNLDNIIEGLTKSFAETYGLVQNHSTNGFEIPNYVMAADGKMYRYNYEIENVYYCPDNIIIDYSEVTRYASEQYIIIDNFILDLIEKQIYLYDDATIDSFPDSINNIKSINIVRESFGKVIEILHEEGEKTIIKIDKMNRIIALESDAIKKIGNNFLNCNKTLLSLSLPNLEQVGRYFLYSNEVLKEIFIPKIQTIGSSFLYHNTGLVSFEAPCLTTVGNTFLQYNVNINYLNLPKLESVRPQFLATNNALVNLNLPELTSVGDGFLYRNEILESFNLPKLKHIEDGFLFSNITLEKVDLPSLKDIKGRFLASNNRITKLNLPNLETIGNEFLISNTILQEFIAPNLRKIGDKFLERNFSLRSLNLPSLVEIGAMFLYYNDDLEELYLPKVIEVGPYFMHYNSYLKKLYVPSLTWVGNGFLHNCSQLEEVTCPNSIQLNDTFKNKMKKERKKYESSNSKK